MKSLERSPHARRSRLWWLVAAVPAVAGIALFSAQRLSSAQAGDPGSSRNSGALSVRTLRVSKGTVDETLRVTGTTAAEKYVSLIVPRLRGNRGGINISITGGSTSVRQITVVSTAGGNSSSGSSASSGGSASGAPSGASDPSAPSVQSTGSGSAPTNAATGFRGASNRFSRGSAARGSSSSSSSSSQSGSSSSAMGPDGLGSAANNFGTGGGGGRIGGGSGDFMQVLRELVKPGSHVKKGDIVAEFDRENMLLRIDDFKSTVAQAEASVQKLRAELEVEKKTHQQSIDVAKGALEKARLDMKTAPVRSDIDTERLKLALEEAEARYKQLLNEVKFVEISQKAQIRTAEIELQQAGNELKRMEGNADRMLVKASMPGMTVMQNMIRSGEMSTIQQGDTLYPGQLFMQIVDPASMVVNATMNQVDVERVRVGQKARVRFDAYPDLELPAHVTAIAAMTKPAGQRGSFFKEVPVYLKLDAIDPRVIPDLSVSADIVLQSEPDAPMLSRGAIFGDDDGTGKPFVLLRAGNGFERREIEIGLRSHTHASIRQGLKPGDEVAVELPQRGEATKVAALQPPGGGN